MFGKLREALSRATATLASTLKEKVGTREIKAGDIEDALDDIRFYLLEAEVAFDVVEYILDRLKESLVSRRISRTARIEDLVRDALRGVLLEILDGPGVEIVEKAKGRCKPASRPYIVVFLGVNGVGKTTTIAKLAYKARRAGLTPVLAAADTFRAGAQEQLAYHAERISVPIVGGRYGADPASVAFDAIEYARARNYCLVLVDTAGRMHTDYDLMGELRKIVTVSKPDLKVLVVDALTGNDAVEQARMFNEGVGVDGSIVTKADADVKGGVAVSVAAVTRKPIFYLGTGQDYSDLVRFDPEKFVSELLE